MIIFYYIGEFILYNKRPYGDAHSVQKKAAVQPHIGILSAAASDK